MTEKWETVSKDNPLKIGDKCRIREDWLGWGQHVHDHCGLPLVIDRRDGEELLFLRSPTEHSSMFCCMYDSVYMEKLMEEEFTENDIEPQPELIR